MKIEHLIVQHLYNNKKVTLEDIGSFFLSPNVTVNAEDKEAVLPENAITFEYQPKAPKDESLVDFIVQHSRKIKPLATSDLESYSILGREYLNIGKPFIIEGLGTLHKTQFGTYEFTQGTTINPKLEAQAAHLKEKDDLAIDFSSPARKNNSGKTGLMVLVVIVIALSAAAIIYFLNRETKTPVNTVTEMLPDTTKTVVIIPVTTDTTKMADSINAIKPIFSVVLKKFISKTEADKAMEKFKSDGHKVIVLPLDSGYVIAMPFSAPITDSTKAKDSLSQIFGVRTSIL